MYIFAKVETHSEASCCTTVHCLLVIYRAFLILSQCLTGWGVLLPDFFVSSFFAPVLGVLGCWEHKISFISKMTIEITSTRKKKKKKTRLKHLANVWHSDSPTTYRLYMGREGLELSNKKSRAYHQILPPIIFDISKQEDLRFYYRTFKI